ncbi:unnamed protein product, partial [Prunus brigantina]
MVLSWLLNSIHLDIANSVIYANTAAEVWSDLRERFSQGNNSRIYHIKREIIEHRQGQQSISAYYNKLKSLWDEFGSYNELATCTCGGIKRLNAREEKEKVMQFLMGLNEAYYAIRGQIMLMDPLPDTRKTYSLVLQQEKQVEVSLNREHLNHHAMSVTSNKEAAAPSHQSYKGKPPLHCSYCDQDRHNVETCYYLHGFPPGHKLHGKSVKPPNRRKSTANHVKAETKSVKNSNTSHTTPTSDGPKFTTEEYNQLMAMLLKNNDGNPQHYANTTGITTSSSPMTHVDPHSKLCWIIDSGATDHVTSSIELTNPQLLPKSATIQLPDGGQTHIESIGSLQMIGLGKQHNGLYYLAQDQTPILAHHIRKQSNLWHQR